MFGAAAGSMREYGATCRALQDRPQVNQALGEQPLRSKVQTEYHQGYHERADDLRPSQAAVPTC